MYINYYNVGSAWLPHHLNNPSAAPELPVLLSMAQVSLHS